MPTATRSSTICKTYNQAIRAFYDAGCRYLQFDDTAWAYLCSQAELKRARERGLNAERLAQDYAGIINKALEGKPADMVVTTHICRRQFSFDLDFGGRLRARRRGSARSVEL